MNVGEVATPDAFVMAVAVLPPPTRGALGPVEGAVKETITPLSGLPPASFTIAASGLANAVLTEALCGVPPIAVIDELPDRVFVKATSVMPGTIVATTLCVPSTIGQLGICVPLTVMHVTFVKACGGSV